MASGDGGGARSSACASRSSIGTPGIIVVRSGYESGATPIGTVRAAEGEPPLAGAGSAISAENPSATARTPANRSHCFGIRLSASTRHCPTRCDAIPPSGTPAHQQAGDRQREIITQQGAQEIIALAREKYQAEISFACESRLNSGSCQYLLKRNLNTPYPVKNSARRPSSSSPITGNTRLIIVAGGYRPRWKPAPRLRYNHR